MYNDKVFFLDDLDEYTLSTLQCLSVEKQQDLVDRSFFPFTFCLLHAKHFFSLFGSLESEIQQIRQHREPIPSSLEILCRCIDNRLIGEASDLKANTL